MHNWDIMWQKRFVSAISDIFGYWDQKAIYLNESWKVKEDYKIKIFHYVSGKFLKGQYEATGERIENTCVSFKVTKDCGTQTVLFLRIASFLC